MGLFSVAARPQESATLSIYMASVTTTTNVNPKHLISLKEFLGMFTARYIFSSISGTSFCGTSLNYDKPYI